jgi:hypothetical protein
MEIATRRFSLENQMRASYLSLDYSNAEFSTGELIRLIEDAGGDPWNDPAYLTAKQVRFRMLNQNPVVKLSPEIDSLRSEILQHGYSLTGPIYAGESLD